MTRQAAKAFYDVQAGDPATGYITPADAQAAIDVIYTDLEAGDTAAIAAAIAGAVPKITTSPEGSRVGAVGDAVLQTTGAATKSGVCLWRKTSGTGSTGWTPEGALADTGWRDVAALMAQGSVESGGILQVRRIGTSLHLAASRVLPANATAALLVLPVGLRPEREYTQFFRARSSATTTHQVRWETAGFFIPSMPGGSVIGTLTAVTSEAWPASLPGTAA